MSLRWNQTENTPNSDLEKQVNEEDHLPYRAYIKNYLNRKRNRFKC